MAISKAKHIMMKASKLITKGGVVTVDDEVYSYPDRYVADGGENMWNKVMDIMSKLDAVPVEVKVCQD